MPSPMDILAEAKQRQQQLLQRLAVAPMTEVLGVVSPTGVSGGKSRGEELWTLRTGMEAWRRQGGTLQNQRLTIRRKVTNEELSKYQELMRPYEVVRLRARVVADSSFGSPEALLESFVGPEASDLELNAVAAKLQEPVTFEDPILGTFSLDRRLNSYAGHAAWNGKTVKLTLEAKESVELQAALKIAHVLWQDQELWQQRVGDYAVQELLPLKNQAWLEENEEELVPDQFKERMTLNAITVHPDGSFDFWHRDGDMFWGHAIQISGSLSKGLTGADIPG